MEARTQGRALPLGGRKQRALLARLAVSAGQPVPAGALIEDLWEIPPQDPAHALQAHVSRLRAVLPVDLELSAGGYRLDESAVQVDAERFTRLCEDGRRLLLAGSSAEAAVQLREALSLWRGSPFADLPDGTGLRPIAVRLETMRQSALADRIDADLACRNGRTTPAELQALVEEHPLAERHWGQLMTALYVEGRPSEALEVYRRARDTCADQLGTEPGEQLRRLHQDMLRGRPAAELLPGAVPEAAASLLSSTGSPQAERSSRRAGFAGRARELDILTDAWAKARRGVTLVTVTGEPGIGKTRLATEFGARLAARDVPVLSGRCDQVLDVAYQPFLEMLRTDSGSRTGRHLTDRLGGHAVELTRLLPELALRLPDVDRRPDDGAPADPGTEQYRTLDAVAGWLATASSTGPVLLVIDDLQWADHETTRLLEHLLNTRRPIRAMIVVTYRDGLDRGAMPGPGAFTPLLRQSDTVTHLPLAGIGEREVSQLVAAELDGLGAGRPAPEELVAWMASASGGNPLFVLELARQYAMLPAGTGTGFPSNLPAGLRGVVDQRLAGLPTTVAERLGYAAIIGRSFDPLVLARVAGCEVAELDDLLDLTVRARLIEPEPGRRVSYTFCHDVVRTVLYNATPPLRRAALHRRVAEAIEEQYGTGSPGHHHALAHHYTEAAAVGPAAPGVHYLKLAGDASLSQRAPSVASDLYQRALELLPEDAEPGLRCDLLIALGIAQFRSGHPAHRETLLKAARTAHDAGDSRRLTAAAVANNRGWYSSTADVDRERVAVIEAALESCDDGDRHARVRLLASWSLENVRDPARRDRAVVRSVEALSLAEEADDEVLLAQAMSHRYTVAYASFSDPHGCVELSERLYDLAHARDDPALQLNAAIGLAQSTALTGDYDSSDRALARSAHLAEELHQPARLWLVRSWQAMRVAMRGDLDRGETLATGALDLGVRTEQPDALTWFAGQLFTFRFLAGRLGELIGDVEEQVTSNAAGIPAWRAAYALTLTEAGREDEGETILQDLAADQFTRLPPDMLWLQGMAYLCEVCATLDRPEIARSLYDALAPWAGLIANNGTIDAGPVDLHLGTMALTLGDHSTADRHLTAAVDTCRRIDAPLWLARAQTRRKLLPAG